MEYSSSQQQQAASGATRSPTTTTAPRRELLGPRPAPLKVRRSWHKMRKPPVAPSGPPAQARQPVIIYMDSPKIVCANPSEFLSVVQRLTGAPASASAPSASPPPRPPPSLSSTPYLPAQGGALSPSAVLEQAAMMPASWNGQDRALQLPIIQSPAPASLPAIPPELFSPLIDVGGPGNGINHLSSELNQAFPGHGTALPGANSLSSPDGYLWDIFKHHQNL